MHHLGEHEVRKVVVMRADHSMPGAKPMTIGFNIETGREINFSNLVLDVHLHALKRV